MSQLKNLKTFYVGYNPDLRGPLPEFNTDCLVDIDGTQILIGSELLDFSKNVHNRYQNTFLVFYVVMGYLDLLFDLLCIVIFSKANSIDLMSLNICFIGINFVIGIIYTPYFEELGIIKLLFFNALQLHIVTNGLDLIRSGRSPKALEYINFKKIDTIIRCFPSMIIQLYFILLYLSTNSIHISEYEYNVLKASVGLGVVSSAASLTSFVDKFNENIISVNTLLYYLYFLAELSLRIIIVVLMYITIDKIAFLILFLEFSLRAFVIFNANPNASYQDHLLSTISYFESDIILDKDILVWQFGFLLSTVELVIFLIFVNVSETSTLYHLRLGNSVEDVTILTCILWLLKFGTYGVIYLLKISTSKPVKPNDQDSINIKHNTIDSETSKEPMKEVKIAKQNAGKKYSKHLQTQEEASFEMYDIYST